MLFIFFESYETYQNIKSSTHDEYMYLLINTILKFTQGACY